MESNKEFLQQRMIQLESTCMEQRELIGMLREQLRNAQTANRALRDALAELEK